VAEATGYFGSTLLTGGANRRFDFGTRPAIFSDFFDFGAAKLPAKIKQVKCTELAT
jgi:hypothetical protein